MQTVKKMRASLVTGIVIAFIATPSLAQRSEDGTPFNAREHAIHDCSVESVTRYNNRDAPAQQRIEYRACMGRHGEDKE